MAIFFGLDWFTRPISLGIPMPNRIFGGSLLPAEELKVAHGREVLFRGRLREKR